MTKKAIVVGATGIMLLAALGGGLWLLGSGNAPRVEPDRTGQTDHATVRQLVEAPGQIGERPASPPLPSPGQPAAGPDPSRSDAPPAEQLHEIRPAPNRSQEERQAQGTDLGQARDKDLAEPKGLAASPPAKPSQPDAGALGPVAGQPPAPTVAERPLEKRLPDERLFNERPSKDRASDRASDAEPKMAPDSPQGGASDAVRATPEHKPAASPEPQEQKASQAQGTTPRPMRSLVRLEPSLTDGRFTLAVSTKPDSPAYRWYVLANPDRLVVNLMGAYRKSGADSLKIEGDQVWSVRIGQHRDHLRLVLDLLHPLSGPPRFEQDRGVLRLELPPAN